MERTARKGTLFEEKEGLCHKTLVYGFRSQEDEEEPLRMGVWICPCLGKLFAISFIFISPFQVSWQSPGD